MQTFEPDQLVLVRYFEGAPWRLRRYSMPCKKGKAHETQDGMVFVDACIIPYSGNEHLLGTTDSPTPKWEPKPGELVAVTGLTQTYAGQSLGAEPDGKKSTLEPAMTYRALPKDLTTRWKLCEPLRKHFTIPEE